MKIKKRIFSLALAGALTLGLLPAFSSPALAADGDTNTYTIDIPSALTVTKTGWNDQTAGIKASGTLADGKKLTVTATSPTNNFNLKSGGNSVAYKLAAESEKEKSYSDATAKTTWEFSKDDLAASGGKTETVGVILEDITTKPAGTYQDTVTFTAKVENAAPTVGTVFPIGTADLGDYYYWNHDVDADRLSMKFRNFGNATISVEDNYSHPSLGNYRVISITSSTAQAIDWEMTQMDPTGPWAEWRNMSSYNYFKVDNYDTTPTGIKIASGSGTEDDPFTFELVFD